jgi:uncharacterized membrane protein
LNPVAPDWTHEITSDIGKGILTLPEITGERVLTLPEVIGNTGDRIRTSWEIIADTGNKVLTPGKTTADTGNKVLTPGKTTADTGNKVLTPGKTTADTGSTVLTPGETTQDNGGGVIPPDRRTPPHFVLAYILLPFLFVGVYVWILYILLPYEQFLLMTGLMLAYIIPPAGKETVIPLGIALGLPWYVVATSVAMVDVGAGLFMAWNFDLALKIPILGSWIGRFMFHGQEFVRQRPWLERLYFVGLALFVMFPLQGSGGIGASIVGRILGMPKAEVVAAIAIGAFAGSFLLALGIEFLKDILLANLAAGIVVILTVVVIIVILYLYSRERKKSREKKD